VPHLDVDLQGKAVMHSEHKAKSNERAARAAAMELAGPDFKIGKPGALHYQRKKRYFPNISANNPHAGFGGDVTDQDNNLVETGFMLKLKGQSKRQKDRRKAFFHSEVPHAGTWVKRASSGLGSPQAKCNTTLKVEDLLGADGS